MRALLVTSLLIAACSMLATSVGAIASPSPGGGTVSICDAFGCRTVATGDGSGGTAGSGSGTAGSGGKCTWKGKTAPCSDRDMGSFNSQDGCYYRVANPMPTRGPVLDSYRRRGGGIYWATCPLPGTGSGGYLWLPQPPAGLRPSPAQLAQRAVASFTFARPSGHRSPPEDLRYDGYPFSYTNLWLFYWTDAGTWKTLTATARAGGVWATVTAQPTSLTFDPGDGASAVSCPGPGRAWMNVDGNNPPSGGACGYQYKRVTSSPITSTQTIKWRISWRGSSGTTGTLPDRSTSTSGQLQVMQIQTVVTR